MDDPLNGLGSDVLLLFMAFFMMSTGMWGVVTQIFRIAKKLWP